MEVTRHETYGKLKQKRTKKKGRDTSVGVKLYGME